MQEVVRLAVLERAERHRSARRPSATRCSTGPKGVTLALLERLSQ